MGSRDLKRYVMMLAVAAVAMAAIVGCSKRNILSDKELAQIFHDAFLANAYSTEQRINLDSLRLYEPIFQSYGYTTEDVQFTIGSFSTRKSARLSDVVEQAIKMLEREGQLFDAQVAILDTISNISVRRTTRVIHHDSLLTLKILKDSLNMQLSFDAPAPGIYHIDFDYMIDSLDTTPKGYRALRWTESADSVRNPKTGDMEWRVNVKRHNSSVLLRGRVATYSSTIVVDHTDDRLAVVLVRSLSTNGKPSVKIKNLTIKHVLQPDKAQDEIYSRLLPIRIFDDEMLFQNTTDSL